NCSQHSKLLRTLAIPALTCGQLRTHPWQGAVCPMAAEAGPAAQAPSAEATRSFKVDPASKDEVEAFIKENNRWIDDAAASELRNMSPEDQRRVISAGTLVSCRDAAGVMRSRVRQAKEKEAILSGSKTEDAATKLSIPASKEEVEAFISANRRWMTPESEEMMKLMNPLDQKRVITGGTLSGCRDSVAVLQTRAKRGREMELEFEMIASGKKVEPPKPASEQMPLPLFSAEAARAFIHATPQEVRSEHSRFASAADPESFVTEETSGPLVGQVKGIGGVIEMLRAKYGCSKGQRLRVIGETPALLQFEGGKTAPKNHEGSGWKWVIGSDASSGQKDEVSRQAEMAATLHARDERLAQEAAQKVKDKERRAAEKAALEELVSKEQPELKEANDAAATREDMEKQQVLQVPKEHEVAEEPTALHKEVLENKEVKEDLKEKDRGKDDEKEKKQEALKEKQEKDKDKAKTKAKEKEKEKEKEKDKKKDKKHKESEKEKEKNMEKEQEKEKEKDKEKERDKDKEKKAKESEHVREDEDSDKATKKKKAKEKDRERSRSEKKERSKERHKKRERSRSRSKSRSKEREKKKKHKSRSRSKGRERAKDRAEKDKDRKKDHEKRKRSTSSDSSRAKKKDRGRAKERDRRKRSESSDLSRAKKKEKERSKETDRRRKSASRSEAEEKKKKKRSSESAERKAKDSKEQKKKKRRSSS
ncbi:unnamed protein product, partial [Durusdinium trenchii]